MLGCRPHAKSADRPHVPHATLHIGATLVPLQILQTLHELVSNYDARALRGSAVIKGHYNGLVAYVPALPVCFARFITYNQAHVPA